MAPPVAPATLPMNLSMVTELSVSALVTCGTSNEGLGYQRAVSFDSISITYMESCTTRLPPPADMAPPNCVTTLRLKVEPLTVVFVLLSSSTEAPSPMLLPAVHQMG
jgi:hypothetical protein